MWKRSLRARLTLYIIVPVILALLAIGGLGFYVAYNQAQEIYDTELSHVANLMLSILSAEDQEEAKHGRTHEDEETTSSDIIEMGSGFENTGQRYDRKLAFRIWKDDQLLFYSKEATDFGAERTAEGFSNQVIKGKKWRFYILPDAKSGYTLEIAQKLDVRTLLIITVLATSFSPLLCLLPVILILTWVGLRTGLNPLVAVSDAVRHRSALDLTPLSTYQSLEETRPLIDSINGLLANLDYALKKERRFADLAAHELRTPIAIFKTQAQTALKATDEAERRMILVAQVEAADRATGLVDRMLSLARLEHGNIPTQELSLGEAAQIIVQERSPFAKQKQINLRFEEPAPVFIQGNKELLAIILSNLIDNAIKYTPAHGEIVVSISAQDKTTILTVSDTGPGIPEDKLPYVTERFYRIAGHHQSGAGLGLTTAKRAAEIMGAVLILQNKHMGHGLEAVLQFSNLTPMI